MIKLTTLSTIGFLILVGSGASRGDDEVARVIYLLPTDRMFRKDYENAIWQTVVASQTWYYGHLGGRTFRIKDLKVEKMRAKHDASWLSHHPAANVDEYFLTVHNAVEEVKSIVGPRDPNETWVIYVDAPGGTGAGGGGTCVMVEHDLVGLTKRHNIGGSAHEIGHAFGLVHSGDKDPGALMRSGGGYTKFPACYLTADDVEKLSANRFFTRGKPESIPEIVLLYDGGCFVEREAGKNWQEWKTNGQVLELEQVDRTEDTVVVVDKSRDIYLLIPLKSGLSYFSFHNTTNWKRLYGLR